MSAGAWIAWGCIALAIAVDFIAIGLEQHRINNLTADLDELADTVRDLIADKPRPGQAIDNQARTALNELRDHVAALTEFVTKVDDERNPSTGRHAHSGEIRASYVRVD